MDGMSLNQSFMDNMAEPVHPLIVDPDPYINSANVPYLHHRNFLDFLKTKDAVLVYFYTPGDRDNEWLMGEYAAASCSTKRPSHAFAAVNCMKEKDLCLANKVTKTPRLNLYSKGVFVSAIRCVSNFKEPAIRQYVEMSPLATQPNGNVEEFN